MLLGREREQAILGRLLQDARASRSGVLAIVGEAGIGKSALLAYAQEQADGVYGMKVLRARGVQSEAHIPFAGLFELLRPALGCLGEIPAPQAAALESSLALRPAAAAGQDRFAVGAGTLSLLSAYADEAPVAVLLDDAQWLDGSSADALLFAFRRLVADPVTVVLTARDGEPSLLDGAGLETLRLGGLDGASAGELLRRQAGEPVSDEVASWLQSETAGNPLALLELSRDRSWLHTVPLENVPLGNVPLGNVPLGSAPLGSAPLGSVPLGSVPLAAGTSVGRRLRAALPVAAGANPRRAGPGRGKR